jgi:2-oxoglutarate ferredoxin oxidoreductase subunit gamma
MRNFKMLFAGFGGQGVLFMGKVTAYAGLLDGREVTWMPSYGPEMRGGTANCSVCLSERPIGSPLVTAPEVLVAMNAPAFDKFIDQVKPGGKVFIDSSLVDRALQRDDITLYSVPATQLSNDEGLEGIANMIVFGKMLGETAFADFATVERALNKSVPAKNAHLIAHNIRAMKLGMET